MPHASRPSSISLRPRPWLTREAGECAFPVEGDGVRLRACCNPSGLAAYCPQHAARMRRPPPQPARDLELEILRFLETRR